MLTRKQRLTIVYKATGSVHPEAEICFGDSAAEDPLPVHGKPAWSKGQRLTAAQRHRSLPVPRGPLQSLRSSSQLRCPPSARPGLLSLGRSTSADASAVPIVRTLQRGSCDASAAARNRQPNQAWQIGLLGLNSSPTACGLLETSPDMIGCGKRPVQQNDHPDISHLECAGPPSLLETAPNLDELISLPSLKPQPLVYDLTHNRANGYNGIAPGVPRELLETSYEAPGLMDETPCQKHPDLGHTSQSVLSSMPTPFSSALLPSPSWEAGALPSIAGPMLTLHMGGSGSAASVHLLAHEREPSYHTFVVPANHWGEVRPPSEQVAFTPPLTPLKVLPVQPSLKPVETPSCGPKQLPTWSEPIAMPDGAACAPALMGAVSGRGQHPQAHATLADQGISKKAAVARLQAPQECCISSKVMSVERHRILQVRPGKLALPDTPRAASGAKAVKLAVPAPTSSTSQYAESSLQHRRPFANKHANGVHALPRDHEPVKVSHHADAKSPGRLSILKCFCGES